MLVSLLLLLPHLICKCISMGWIILNVFLAHIYALILLHVTDLPVFVEYLWPIVFLVHNYGILLGQWSSVPLLHSPGRWCNSTGVFRPQSPLADIQWWWGSLIPIPPNQLAGLLLFNSHGDGEIPPISMVTVTSYPPSTWHTAQINHTYRVALHD